MIHFKRHIRVALVLFLAAASLGLLMRLAHATRVPYIIYKFLQHAHSHTAMLGWVYIVLTTLIGKLFLKNYVPIKTYKTIYVLTIVSALGMLFSFPFQGYKLISICFSTLYLIVSYLYTWMFIKYYPKYKRVTPSYRVIRYALIYLVISSLGTWAIGGIMVRLGSNSPWYNSSIYFYLHFQYNAWMILAIIGVVLKIIEYHNIGIDEAVFKKFLRTFNIAAVSTYLISILFVEPPSIIYSLSIAGSFIQLGSVLLLFSILKSMKEKLRCIFNRLSLHLLECSLLLLFIKCLMQLLASIPPIAHIVTVNVNLTIGFLHWVFLGVITFAMLGLLRQVKLLHFKNWVLGIFAAGFISTEFIIFYKPLEHLIGLPILPNYAWSLFFASGLLVLSIILFLVYSFRK